jgi:hypothetical protein
MIDRFDYFADVSHFNTNNNLSNAHATTRRRPLYGALGGGTDLKDRAAREQSV